MPKTKRNMAMSGERNKNRLIRLLVGVIFLIMAIEIFYLVKQNRLLQRNIEKLGRDQMESIDVGSHAPEFQLPDLDGKTIRISDFDGKNLLLIFFSTECSACLMDIPNWRRLASLQNDNFHILWICQGEPDDIREFAIDYSLPFEIAVDRDGRTKELYECKGVPQKILLNEGGYVDFVEAGAIQRSEMGEMQRRLSRL